MLYFLGIEYIDHTKPLRLVQTSYFLYEHHAYAISLRYHESPAFTLTSQAIGIRFDPTSHASMRQQNEAIDLYSTDNKTQDHHRRQLPKGASS